MADATRAPEQESAGAREAAILDAIGAVMRSMARSSFELREVLETVIAEAVRLCHAEMGNILRPDPQTGRWNQIAFHGPVPPAFWELVQRTEFKPDRSTLVGRTLLERKPIHIVDALADPEYQFAEGQRLAGYRTILGVPVLRDGVPIAILVLYRNHVEAFAEPEIAVLQAFGDQVAIAIHVANLVEEMREAVERERAVSGVLQTISGSTFDLTSVLQTVIEAAVELGHADFGNIVRLDESTGYYQVMAHHGDVDEAYWDLVTRTRYKPDRGTLIGRTLVELRPVHIPDILEDPEYRFWESQRTGRFRTILGIPMLRDASPIGVFVVWRREVRPFSEREIVMLTTFSDQAVLAIENVRLFETVERQRAELARFAPQVASLLSSGEGERLLSAHRREISAMFCDLRGFTAFAEMAEPEEVLDVLREYHAMVGERVVGAGGTVEHFAGDGLMAFFNDPTPVADHQRVAVEAAIAIRDEFARLASRWRKRGYELGIGIGIAAGYATLGRIGFEGRYDYGAVGNVVILASRLSDSAEPGEILISQRVHAALDDEVRVETRDAVTVKGFSRPVPVFAVPG